MCESYFGSNWRWFSTPEYTMGITEQQQQQQQPLQSAVSYEIAKEVKKEDDDDIVIIPESPSSWKTGGEGKKRGRKPKTVATSEYEVLQRQRASIKEKRRAERMKCALDKLKDCLPAHFHAYYRPMSKVKTLRLATSYIAALGTLTGCQCEAHKGESLHLHRALGLSGDISEMMPRPLTEGVLSYQSHGDQKKAETANVAENQEDNPRGRKCGEEEAASESDSLGSEI